MKKFYALLLVTAFLCTGCIQMHMDTTIDKDGSGTMTMTYGMSPSVAEAMAELAEMPGSDDEKAPTMDDFDEETLKKACKRHDCKLKDFSKTVLNEIVKLPVEIADWVIAPT